MSDKSSSVSYGYCCPKHDRYCFGNGSEKGTYNVSWQCPDCTEEHACAYNNVPLSGPTASMENKRLIVEEGKESLAETKGIRYNTDKDKLSWVPASLERAVAKVLWKSAKENGGKYPAQNWRKGMSWSETGESLLRHVKSWLQDGEDVDKESGLPTLYHVATNVAFLIEYMETHPELDDRFKKVK